MKKGLMNSRRSSMAGLDDLDDLNEEEAKEIIGKILRANGFKDWCIRDASLALRRKGDQHYKYNLGIKRPMTPGNYCSCWISLGSRELKSPYKTLVKDWILDMKEYEQLYARRIFARGDINLGLFGGIKSLDELRIKVDLM